MWKSKGPLSTHQWFITLWNRKKKWFTPSIQDDLPISCIPFFEYMWSIFRGGPRILGAWSKFSKMGPIYTQIFFNKRLTKKVPHLYPIVSNKRITTQQMKLVDKSFHHFLPISKQMKPIFISHKRKISKIGSLNAQL